MATKILYLYKNITPNINKYFYFSSYAQLHTKLNSNLVSSFSPDKYTFNNNIFKIKLSSYVTETVKYQITYITEEETDANNAIINYRAWHVNRIIYQSGYIICYCSVDLWASYLLNASISNFNVTRCNRNLNVGLLDNLRSTKGALTHTYCAVSGRSSGTNNELWDIKYSWIVFALKFNIEQTQDGAISNIKLYAFNLKDLKQLYYDNAVSGGGTALEILDASCINAVTLACDVVGGIYGIAGVNGFGVGTTLDAQVLAVYFCHQIATVTATNTTIKTKANWKWLNTASLTPLEVIPAEYKTTLTITNDFDKQLYVGTLANGLKLVRTTETTISVDIRTITSSDKLTIIASQGDTQQDITSAFAVTLGTKNGDVTSNRQIASAVESYLKIAGSGFAMVKGAVTGNALTLGIGATSFTGAVADAVGNANKQHIGGQVNGADGILAFYRILTDIDTVTPANNVTKPLHNPFIVNAYSSIDDEQASVRVFGASFNELTNIATVFTKTLLGTGTLTDTFIKASCWVDNIPSEASDFIKSSFERGIYLEKLT